MGSPGKCQCKAGKAVEPTAQRRHRSLRAGICRSSGGKEQVTPSAREGMLGITAALAPQFLILVNILSTRTVDKFSGRSTLDTWEGNSANRQTRISP